MTYTLRERLAREHIRARGGSAVADSEHWPEQVAHYNEMCARYPDYAESRSLIHDAFRDADIAIAFIAAWALEKAQVESAADAIWDKLCPAIRSTPIDARQYRDAGRAAIAALFEVKP